MTPTQTTSFALPRYFTHPDAHPYDRICWDRRTARIAKDDGTIVFEQPDIEVPSFWSETASNVTASKYFRGQLNSPDRERSVKTMVDRVVNTIAEWGFQDTYFSDRNEAKTFRQELKYILIHQMASFNSPVWFNIGVQGRPQQASACFILNVEDSMDSITNWYKEEAIIFKGGSGSGVNVSKLRGKNEPLSGGGKASGPLSFMKAADASAGAIKSGGVTRRAAKIVIMDVDHPDIFDFIWAKAREEKKANVLIAAGYNASIDGEAYSTIAHQNANYSISVPDNFLRRVLDQQIWHTKNRTNDERQEHKAKNILHEIALACHECGDPGLFFKDTVNAWHTTPGQGEIVSSNPCQPGFATVLTPQGIRTFDDIDIGSVIWSGKRWTRVTQKIATGRKPVHAYYTSAGIFIGTKDHHVIAEGKRTKVSSASTIDIARVSAYQLPEDAEFEAQAVVDGLVCGDGTAKPLSTTNTTKYVLLNVGEKDQCYFDPESGVADYINPVAFDVKEHRVKTTIAYEEVVKTYNRFIPERYLYAGPETVRSFLRGLYSANGSIVGDRVSLKAASFAVIHGVQQMLSSLGIASYYTTNKAHDVTFKNGTYTCKESYDLNITSDRERFRALIGFIHPDKMRRLNQLCTRVGVGSRRKSTYEVSSIEYLGVHPVFDITVEALEHTYWTGGLLVSNCAEFIRPPNEACNLASLNLLKFLNSDNSFDIEGFCHTVDVLITAMDILVGRADYPTPAIAQNSHNYRTLGLGYANLGALLMARGLPYDSDEGRDYAASITALMTGHAYRRSAQLAQIKGPFAGFAANRDSMLAVMTKHDTALDALPHSPLHAAAGNAWSTAIVHGSEVGYRNAQVSLLAPTGTISIMMDCATTGIEPDVALVNYKALVGGGTIKKVNPIVERALKTLGYNGTTAEILKMIETDGGPYSIIREEHVPVFDCAFPSTPGGRSIDWRGHVAMVAAVQPFLSGGVSKTINMPNSATVEDIEEAYLLAWKLGCKSIAIYRDGCKQTQVLTTKAVPQVPPIVTEGSRLSTTTGVVEQPDVTMGGITSQRRRLPDERPAITHKFSVGGQEGYFTVGLYDDGRPAELFVRIAKEGSTLGGVMDAWATLVSLSLQYGVPLKALTSKLRNARYEPMGFTSHPDIHTASSLTDYIAQWLDLKFGNATTETSPRLQDKKDISTTPRISDNKRQIFQTLDMPLCSECGSLMIRTGACCTCPACGASGGCG